MRLRKIAGYQAILILLLILIIQTVQIHPNVVLTTSADSKSPAIIVPYDVIALPGIEVWPQAKVFTKKFFAAERPAGGERIEFFEGDRYLGLALTGGDGIGVIRYIPHRQGVHKIRVRLQTASSYEAKEAEGVIAVWDRTKPVVLVSIEAVREKPKHRIFPFFSDKSDGAESKPVERSVDVMSSIHRRYNVIYLYRGSLSLVPDTKSWLGKNKFPSGPVIIWDGSKNSVNRFLSERLKDIKGVVVTADDEAKVFQEEGVRTILMAEKKKVSEFKKILKDATIVTDWNEIKKVLLRED